MNSYQLKVLAFCSMLIDHIGAILFPDIVGFRVIGRIAFPIFCFLLVEGYKHTRNVYEYAKRLFEFALISEPIYNLAFFNRYIVCGFNILFEIFLGLLTVYILDRKKNYVLLVPCCYCQFFKQWIWNIWLTYDCFHVSVCRE